MKIKFARSARRHRVGQARALAAMQDAGEPQRVPDAERSEQLVWIGHDDRGVLLEVVAVERPDVLLVIHVMPAYYRERRY